MRPDLPLHKNASVPVVDESKKGDRFMFTVFSKSVVLRTKLPFKIVEAVAL